MECAMTSLTNEKRGGTRLNAGPKFKYGEPTTPVLIRVPNSKIAIFRAKAKEILKVWETIDKNK
jgi:hypothetical protein